MFAQRTCGGSAGAPRITHLRRGAHGMLGAQQDAGLTAVRRASEQGVRVAQPSRRLVLTAAAAGSLTIAGCKGITALGPVPKLGLDVVTLEHAINAEELMVARYRSAVTALAAEIGPGAVSAKGRSARAKAEVEAILTEHEAHLERLKARLVLPQRLATARPRPSPTPSPLPSGRHAILAALTAAETTASERLIRWLNDAPPALAQLMASIAASEAAHVVLLGHPGGRQ
jgi:hypothetical protein